MRGPGFHRALIGLVTLALAVTGLLGAFSYWESYYQHRGFTEVAYLPHARKGRHLTVHFYSTALHREADYLVYLPPGYYRARRRYPVYYLLHGSPGRPQVFYAIANLNIRMDNLISQHRMRPMILVYPDGRIGGSTYSDSEWANTPSGDYESYVIDVVRNVDQRFATIASRRDRVIAGFSAGAYGATNITLHHLSVFGNLQSWSGYYTETRSGVFAGASRATLAYNSPIDYVRRLRAQLRIDPLRAFLFIGRDDNDSPQQQPMASALAAEGARVSYALYSGGHDWQLWHAHLDQMLILASRDVSEPLRPGKGKAGSLTPGVVPIPHGAGHRHGEVLPLAPGDVGLPHGVLRLPHGIVRLPAGVLRLPDGVLRLPNGVLLLPNGHLQRPREIRPRHRGRRSDSGRRRPNRRQRRHHRRPRRHPRVRRPRLARLFDTRPPDHPTFIVNRLTAGPGLASRRPGEQRRRARLGLGELLAGLILALGSAALINLGFLLQHRGLRQRAPGGLASMLRGAVRNRIWLAGQALGWIGFIGQIIAVAIAPLALVQAFAAGGLALSVPLAAGFFKHRITSAQLLAVLLIAVSLATLPIGFSSARDRLHPTTLALAVAVFVLLALAVSGWRSSVGRAIAAGLFYGVADAAIKAISVGWRAHGLTAVLSGWTALAAAGTFAGFLAFQSALSNGGAVSPISVMNALAALAGLACGLAAFGESLGASGLIVGGHLVAIAVVLGCVPVLAAAQAGIAGGAEPAAGRPTPPSGALRPEYRPG